jgi:DNA-binding Lrp family transcriptional regulator
MSDQTPQQQPPQQERQITEEIEVAANQLVDRVKELVQEGSVRRLIIRNNENRVLLEIPLTAGVAAGAALTLFMPLFAALGAMAALVAQVKIEIVRTDVL